MNTLPKVEGFAPTRIIIDAEGYAVTPEMAAYQSIFPDITFIRDDGWSLGAPSKFEDVAHKLWKNSWTHFFRKSDKEWSSIGDYS